MSFLSVFSFHIPTNRRNSRNEILPSPSLSAAAIISSSSGLGIFTGKFAKTNCNSSVLTNPSDSGSNLQGYINDPIILTRFSLL